MLGRYHYYCLHPFSLNEITHQSPQIHVGKALSFSNQNVAAALELLLKFGGFPEPLLAKNINELRRWHQDRKERLIKEDIRDLTAIRELTLIELLIDTLPQKVKSLLSVNALREDLEVNHKTLTNWLGWLEALYYCYRIYPFKSNKIRSIKKAAKLYLWDWSEITDESARFENLVASHLLKLCHFLRDALGYKTELFFLRDVMGREVDFLVTIGQKPWFAVEAKLTATQVDSSLPYFQKQFQIPFCYQIVKNAQTDIWKGTIRVMNAAKFLSGLI